MSESKSNAGPSSVTISSTTRAAGKGPKKTKVKKSVSGTTSVVVTSSSRANKASSRRRAKRGGARMVKSTVASSYVATLNDPFTYPGVPVGFGCLIPTSLETVYLKGSLAVNATDGSFSIVSIPYACGTGGAGVQGAVIATSTTGASTNQTYAFAAASNNTNFLTTCGFARVISGGLRVFVRYPATSAPGIMNAWTASTSASAVSVSSPNSALPLPQATMCGKDEVTISYRPSDMNDFSFASVNNGGVSNTCASWQGYIQGIGYPATTTTVFYETIYHLEVYSTSQIVSNDIAPSMLPSVSDYFPSVETALKYVRQNLTPEVVEAAGDVLFKGAPLLLSTTAARRMQPRLMN